eukprot:TRINITY_DN2129_c0_g1_i1.p1 TRINITY_DN2129_c0_g1~~TRINITY_DN2129_c0_g1_i1.p1  ORF type:complete len:651 (-),score=91.39 TRINITY_DN2129_c0_g1_i1:7339-9222(-)
MQPLKSVRGTLVRTTILDKYLNVQVNPASFCTQGKRQFFTVSASDDKGNDSHYILKSMEHSTDTEEFNIEIESLLEGWNLNKTLSESPNIAKILGVRLGKEPGTGRIYSETLIEDCGESLLDYVSHNEISIVKLADYADQVVQALVFAHTQGIYHGDLRPEKIFVKDKVAKVLDFGGALFIGAENSVTTKKLLANWNTAYWPPEKFTLLDPGLSKAEKKEMLASFDVYSWGITFYQLLTKKTTKELEKENVLYKQTADSYKGFTKLLNELSAAHKSNAIFHTYFDPLLKMSLEFSPTKRATIFTLRDHSYHNKGVVAKKEGSSKKKKELSAEVLAKMESTTPEVHKGMCHACMKSKNAILKGNMQCGHNICENCIKDMINKIVIEKAETGFEFYCYVCKEKQKVKEIYLKCKCPCDIEKMRNENKKKVMSFAKEKGKICTALCSKNHELTEEEAFVIFGNLKLSLRNEKVTKEAAVTLSNAMEKMHLIETVDLRQNQIEYIGLEALTGVLGAKSALTELHLDWNPIGSDGGKAIKGLLETTTSLKELTMGMTQSELPMQTHVSWDSKELQNWPKDQRNVQQSLAYRLNGTKSALKVPKQQPLRLKKVHLSKESSSVKNYIIKVQVTI